LAAVGAARAAVHYEAWAVANQAAEDDPVNGGRIRLAWLREAAGRLAASLVLTVIVLGVGWALLWPPGWSTVVAGLAGVIVVGVLGAVGRTAEDPPLVEETALSATPPQPLSEPRVLKAVAKVTPNVDQADEDKAAWIVAPGLVKVPGDITGSEVTIDLPEGVVAGAVIRRREALASALRISEWRVWPEAVRASHPGRFRLFLSDEPLGAAAVIPWPLLTTGVVNVFDGFPIGQDQRGQWIPVRLVTQSGIIAAKSRMGKTFLLKVLLGGAALDARVELWVYDAKGGADLMDLERVAYRFGSTNDEDALAEQVLGELKELKSRMSARYNTMSDLKRRGVSTATEVNDTLAGTPDLDLHPIVVAIDECHELFQHPDLGDQIEALVATISKRGPAVGIIILLATQEPDADAIPTSIRNNAGARWCFRVMSQAVNDMALGTSAYRNGWDATAFEDSDKGLCWYLRPDGPPVILKVAYLNDEAPDGDEFALVIDRARLLRHAAGTITGYATGDRFAPEVEDTTPLVVDLVAVRPQGVDQVANAELVRRLQDHKPGTYAGYATGTLKTRLKELYGDRDPDDDLVGPPKFVQVPAKKPDGSPTRLQGLDMGWLYAAYAELIDEQQAVPIPEPATL
jgi:S-DNA-T family DNA segregation ATPase FtsK/SpoIIIE